MIEIELDKVYEIYKSQKYIEKIFYFYELVEHYKRKGYIII